jgi:hypothetical protein
MEGVRRTDWGAGGLPGVDRGRALLHAPHPEQLPDGPEFAVYFCLRGGLYARYPFHAEIRLFVSQLPGKHWSSKTSYGLKKSN